MKRFYDIQGQLQTVALVAIAFIYGSVNANAQKVRIGVKDASFTKGLIETLASEYNKEYLVDNYSADLDSNLSLFPDRISDDAENVNYTANGEWISQGNLSTGIGHATYDIVYDQEHFLTGTISGDSINIGKLQEDERFGTASFNLDLAMNLDNTHPFPIGKASGTIHNIHYNGYNYQNINLDAKSTATEISGTANIHDENVKANADFAYIDSPTKGIDLNVILEDCRPNNLNITNEHIGESISLNGTIHMQGTDFKHLYGNAQGRNHADGHCPKFHQPDVTPSSHHLQTADGKSHLLLSPFHL